MGNKTAKPIPIEVIPPSITNIENTVPDTVIFENISISINDIVQLLRHYLDNYNSYVTKEEFYNILDSYITYKDSSAFVKKGDILLKGNATLNINGKEEFLKAGDFKRFKEKLKVEISTKFSDKISKKIGEAFKELDVKYSSVIEDVYKIKEGYVSKEELKESLEEMCNEFSKEIENVRDEVGQSIEIINKVIGELNNNVVDIKESKTSYVEDNYDSLVNIVNSLNETLNECNNKIKERDVKIEYLENKIINSEEKIRELEDRGRDRDERVSEMESNMEKIKGILNNILSKK